MGLNQLPSFSDCIYFGNVYEDRLTACDMFLIVLGAISKPKKTCTQKKWANVCEVHFFLEEKIVRITPDSRNTRRWRPISRIHASQQYVALYAEHVKSK